MDIKDYDCRFSQIKVRKKTDLDIEYEKLKAKRLKAEKELIKINKKLKEFCINNGIRAYL